MSNDTWTLILLLAAVFGALAAIAAFSSRGSLDSNVHPPYFSFVVNYRASVKHHC